MPTMQALEDIVALWPEMPWRYANVVAEGPSIAKFDPERLLLGPVVAVNRALGIKAVRADMWATTDNPANLWDWSEPHRNERLRYFTTDQNLGAWSSLLGESNLRKIYSTDMTHMGMDTPEGLPIILPTVITLLGWLVNMGVKRIRVFGCDMVGRGSPMGSDGWDDEQDPHWSSRWAVERILFAHTIREANEHGARIERWPKSRFLIKAAGPTSS